MVQELCPGCARDYQNPETGLCDTCSSERLLRSYLDADGERIVERRDRWKDWSQTADHLRERQRRHRLREKVRPREPAHPNSDPWELGGEALDLLHRIRRGLPGTSPVLDSVEECAELIRMLAWGLESAPRLPKAEVKITPGRIGMHNRWHVKGGKPCNCPLALAEELRKKARGKAARDAARVQGVIPGSASVRASPPYA